MKRVVLDRDTVAKNALSSRSQEFITPRSTSDNCVYAFFKDQRFYLITKTGEDYKIVPLITGDIDPNRFSTLRGAVKHCLKKKSDVWEFGSSIDFSKWMAHVQGCQVLVRKTNCN